MLRCGGVLSFSSHRETSEFSEREASAKDRYFKLGNKRLVLGFEEEKGKPRNGEARAGVVKECMVGKTR